MEGGILMSCKVSVIVPAYNVEDYLYKCLKSIQEQSFAEIEWIDGWNRESY